MVRISTILLCSHQDSIVQDLAGMHCCDKHQLKPHPKMKTVLNIDWTNIPRTGFVKDAALIHLLKVYIDNFIAMIQCNNVTELTCLTCCILLRITNIFSLSDVSNTTMYPLISEKKLIKEGA